jgi:hypothetical protein
MIVRKRNCYRLFEKLNYLILEKTPLYMIYQDITCVPFLVNIELAVENKR